MCCSNCSCCDSLTNCCHKGVPLDIYDTVECTGTVIGRQTVTWWYLLWRVFVALYESFILAWAVEEYIRKGWNYKFFLYITHWGLIADCCYAWSSLFLHVRVYRAMRLYTARQLDEMAVYPTVAELGLRRSWQTTLAIIDTFLVWSIFVIVLYYAILFDGGDLHPRSWHTHGVAGGLIILDWITSCWQLTYRGAFTGVISACCWIALSLIFWLADWTDKRGNKYIYEIVDWEDAPLLTAAYAAGGLVAIALMHFALVFVKNQILRCWIASKAAVDWDKYIVVEKTGASGGIVVI